MDDNLYTYLKKIYRDKFNNNKLLQIFISSWSMLKTSFVEIGQFDGTILYPIISKLYDEYIPQTDLLKDDNLVSDDNQLSSDTDYRCKYILLANTRGIGDYKDGYPFGINLLKENKIQNAVIIGHNGSGKSSIFSAMEYIYCGDEIGEKQYRNYKGNGLRYLENEKTKKSSSVEISTPSGDFSFGNRICDLEKVNKTNPSVSFISEYDILINSQIEINDDSYTMEIAEKLGFIDFTNFKTNLNTILKYQFSRSKKNTEYKKAIDKLKVIEANIINVEKEIETLNSENSTSVIKSNESESSIKINEIEELLNKKISLPDMNHIKIICDHYLKINEQLKQYKSDTQKTLKRSKIDFLQQGMQFLEDEKNCPFCNDSRKDYQRLKEEISETIISFKDYSKLNEENKQYFENASLKLISLLSILKTISGMFDTEIYFPINDEINSEYKVLLNDTNAIIESINYDDILEGLHSIEGNGYNDIDRDILTKIIKENGEKFFSTSFFGEIDKRLNLRNTLLNEIKQKLLNNSEESGHSEKINTEVIIKQKKDEYDKLLKDKAEYEDKQKAGLKEIEIYNKIISDAKKIFQEVGSYIDSIVESRVEPIKEVITDAIKDFLDDNMSIIISFKDVEHGDTISKKLQIKLKYNETEIDPKKYFNNARYKMFATTLAIGIALASRKNTNINLPLVMDDEFFDCDIIKRSEFEIFFAKIILLYYKFSPEMPFQFILFTHDELIFESTAKAIQRAIYEIQLKSKYEKKEYHEYWESSLASETIFARLFDYKDSDSKEKIVNEKKYWDLIVEL